MLGKIIKFLSFIFRDNIHSKFTMKKRISFKVNNNNLDFILTRSNLIYELKN